MSRCAISPLEHERHTKQDFKSEHLRMLRRDEIEFDEKYVID